MLFVAVYMVFAFQRGPETDTASDAAASSHVAGGETSRKRKHDDCDKPTVESACEGMSA